MLRLLAKFKQGLFEPKFLCQESQVVSQTVSQSVTSKGREQDRHRDVVKVEVRSVGGGSSRSSSSSSSLTSLQSVSASLSCGCLS